MALPLKGGVMGTSTVSMVSWLLGSTILKYRFDDLKQWRTVPLLSHVY